MNPISPHNDTNRRTRLYSGGIIAKVMRSVRVFATPRFEFTMLLSRIFARYSAEGWNWMPLKVIKV